MSWLIRPLAWGCIRGLWPSSGSSGSLHAPQVWSRSPSGLLSPEATCVGGVLFQYPAEFRGVICGEINFVVGAVEGEPDGSARVLAGKVIDQLDGPWCPFVGD
jgi:hypothetical protein